MNNVPILTVLMSVRNGEKYLAKSIDSILNQTFNDFEFLIIDDGSTDSTRNIINSFNDSRIKLIINRKNLGLTKKSLNIGLQASRGRFIARQDCDDISLPNRLDLQVMLLKNNLDVGICGGRWKTIPSNPFFDPEIWLNTEEIKCSLLFQNTICHSTVMMRKSLLQKYNLFYNENLYCSQDYELWTRAINFFDIENISDVVLLYRLHPDRIGIRYSKDQIINSRKVMQNVLDGMGINFTLDEYQIHEKISNLSFFPSMNFLDKSEKWLLKLKKVNIEYLTYDPTVFNKILSYHWFSVCNNSSELGLKSWRKYLDSVFSNDFQSYWKIFRLFTKSILQIRNNYLNILK